MTRSPKAAKRPLPNTDWQREHGPFDIIGDVHGCVDELILLLARLGYDVRLEGEGPARRAAARAPAGRRAVFVGDLVDRGPGSPDVVRVAMTMAAQGQALAVIGNHDDKAMRWLKGNPVKLTHGLERTAAQYEGESENFRAASLAFLADLPSYLWLDEGRLAVAHAGLEESMLGRNTESVRRFCLYGEVSGEVDADGLPERVNWALEYEGAPLIVYGHTPVAAPEWVGNTVCIDTGCVFGGRLTALRWPEREVVSVPALKTYAEQHRPFGLPPPRPAVPSQRGEG